MVVSLENDSPLSVQGQKKKKRPWPAAKHKTPEQTQRLPQGLHTLEKYKKIIFLAPTDVSEIHSFIKNLPNKSAAGVDGIKAEPFKAVSQYISLPLLQISNLILSTGIFPDKLMVLGSQSLQRW